MGILLGGIPTLPDNNISPVCVAHFSNFKKKKKNYPNASHLISAAQEWINEIPSVPIYLAQLVRATEE